MGQWGEIGGGGGGFEFRDRNLNSKLMGNLKIYRFSKFLDISLFITYLFINLTLVYIIVT